MFDYLISSMGGVGSTGFMDYVKRYRSTNHNHFRPGSSPYKHALRPPCESHIRKALFMFGDPYNAVLSLNRRGLESIHLVNRGLRLDPNPPEQRIDLEAFLADLKDPYELELQFDSWRNAQVPYPILFVKYETMWNHREAILDYLDIGRSELDAFPPYRPRSSDWTKTPASTQTLLASIYGPLFEKIRVMDEISQRLPCA